MRKLKLFYEHKLRTLGVRLSGNLRRKVANPLVYIKRERIENLLIKVRASIYEVISSLNSKVYVTSEPLPFEKRKEGRPLTVVEGDQWGDLFDCGWFNFTGEVNELGKGKKIVAVVDIAGEGLVVDDNGLPFIGITTFASDYDYRLGLPVKKIIPLFDYAKGNECINFWVDGACNDLFGNLINSGRLIEKNIAIEHEDIKALYYDMEILLSLYDNLTDSESGQILKLISKLSKKLKNLTPENIADIRKEFKTYLDKKNDSDKILQYYAVGHAHLDLAWLWPLRETYRKGARTFSTQLHNIEKYPEYIFGASQAQLYDWMDKKYPELFKRVEKAVESGNWDVQGAAWVEMDTNLIGGESMYRQFIYGKNYFKNKFGFDINIFWIPDSFGYSGCLPQVMKHCGVDYFLTQKMSWNEINKFPYHTFYWKGIDGTAVLAHMLPEDTYNSPVSADRMLFGYKNFKEKDISNKAMSLFGIGDGGGGPGEEHIEKALRLNNLKGIPKYKMSKSEDFFKLIDNGTKYPTYQGELYLERHRGTYTTQAKNKKYNRKIELLLREYEQAFARLRDKAIINQAELDEIWKEVLLYQFHDILPGSSIKRVYDETNVAYENIYNKLKKGIESAYTGMFKSQTVYNSLSWDREYSFQKDGKWFKLTVPALSAKALSDGVEIKDGGLKVSNNLLENNLVKVVFENGLIVSYFDKISNTEYIEQGKKANKFTLYDDRGDCWDIRPYDYKAASDQPKLDFISSESDGYVGKINLVYKVLGSTITQAITLKSDSSCVEFDTKINYNETHKMLRVAFPLTIKANECNFNIQYGHIARPTTHQTKLDWAKFEVSGHKFVDMSDEAKGMTLINDCKFGYKCWDNVIDMNLVRSPMHPGKNADKDEHTLKYMLYPHSGKLDYNVYNKAYEFNIDPVVVDGNGNMDACDVKPFINIDNKNIIVDHVKPTFDGKGIVVRLYNCSTENQTLKLQNVKEVTPFEVNVENHTVSEDGELAFRAFEVKTILL